MKKKIILPILTGTSVFMIFYGGSLGNNLLMCLGAGLLVAVYFMFALS